MSLQTTLQRQTIGMFMMHVIEERHTYPSEKNVDSFWRITKIENLIRILAKAFDLPTGISSQMQNAYAQ